MQPSDPSKPPKMTLGPLPTPPLGSRPPPTPAAKGAPAVGTGILSGSGLNFGPAFAPPRREPAHQGQPVLVTVPRPAPPRPAPHEPIPMKGVLDAYAKGAKQPVEWPDARPATRRAPVAAPESPPAPEPRPAAAPEPVEDPGPAPAWMSPRANAAKGANRTPLYVGGAVLLAVGAIGTFALLTRHPSEPAAAPVQAAVEQPAPAPIAPEPLRPLQEVATAEAPPPVTPESAPKPAAKPRKMQTAAAEPAYRPVAKAPIPPPVQVTPQPLAVAPPPAPVQAPPPRIIIPHLDPSAPIETRSSADQ